MEATAPQGVAPGGTSRSIRTETMIEHPQVPLHRVFPPAIPMPSLS